MLGQKKQTRKQKLRKKPS